jgi:outer membrane protein
MKRVLVFLCWLALAAPGATLAQALEAPAGAPSQLQQADALIRDNKSEEAYALLAPLEPTQAGNVEYDYLLGVSAVNSGRPALAVFALERVQATDPLYRDAGLWLAIAYYQSGDLDRAKPAFEAVVAQSSSAEARDKAQRYLETLDQEEARKQGHPTLLGRLEGGIGYDSNITNSAAGLSAPQLAAAVPAPSSNRGGLESVVNLMAEGRIPISRHYAFVSAEDQRRDYNGNDFMSSDLLAVRGGMNFVDAQGDSYRLSIMQRQFRQQGTLFAASGITNDYDMGGGELRTRRKLSPHDYLGYIVQYNQIRFLTNSPENTDQAMAGVNYTHLFQTRGKPVLYLGYTYLYDQAVQSKISFNPQYGDGTTVASRGTHFISGYFQYSLSAEVDLVSTDYVYLRQDMGAFARDATVAYGRDRTSFLSLGVNWRIKPQWSLRSQVGHTANRSNIPVYSYDKTEVLVLLRRDFN